MERFGRAAIVLCVWCEETRREHEDVQKIGTMSSSDEDDDRVEARTTPAISSDAEGRSTRGSSGTPKKTAKKVVKPLTKKKLEKHLADAENRGVLYFSRIPPFLKPDALRTMLSGMGTEVLRVYLQPETAQQRSGRVRAGGNKKKSFSDGWVEFEDKRRAKRIASTLNNTRMSNDKRSFYYHDLWNVKYLHKFKWHHLTEKIAYEQRVKRDKMVAELTAAKKESAFYMKKVEQAKAIDAMEERKRKRSDDAPPAGAAAPAGVTAAEAGLQSVRRKFKQRKVAKDPATASSGSLGGLSSLLKRHDGN